MTVFSRRFSREEVGRDFFLNYLPPEIVRLLDLKSARLSKDSFLDKRLRAYFSDLVYEVLLRNGKGSVFVHVVLEHKSYPDRLVSFQLLCYMVRVWERILRKYQGKKRKSGEKGEKAGKEPPFLFPPILPVLICHGRSAWNTPPDFRSLFPDLPEFASHIPDFTYVICDLSSHSDDEIRGMVMLRVAMLVMKHIFKDDLAERLPDILALLRDLAQRRSGLEFLETIMVYLSRGTGRLSEEKLGESVMAAFPETGGTIMQTLAEKWFRQGETKGKIEGKIEGLLQGIELALDIRYGDKGLRLLPEIRKIRDADVLSAIYRGLKARNSLRDLRQIYGAKSH